MPRGWVSSASYRAIVQTLVQARISAGLTQRALAAKIERPPSFVAKIELCERRLDVFEFILIARGLGLEPADLLRTAEANLPEAEG